MARMAAFWSLAVLALWGARALDTQLGVWFPSMERAFGSDGAGDPGFHLPVVDVFVSPAFLVASVVGAASVYLIYRWLERPKNADLLIDTESELRKVVWPTFKDVVNSSLVVILCVLFLMAFLAGTDIVIGRVTKLLWFGVGA